MATGSARTFEVLPEDRPRGWRPLIIGIAGESSSGKTYTALRLAAGIQRVLGGSIFGVDTEAGRMRHYEEFFRFRYVRFDPPFGPTDYIAVIDQCVAAGARIIVIDSMTHEHSGQGGVLDQIDKYLEEKCGNDFDKRQRMGQVAHIVPKRARKKLNQRIVALGEVVFILCYQAGEKLSFKKKPAAGDQRPQPGAKRDNEPENLGYQPDTTSRLHFNMTIRFLVKPGCEGRPTLQPEIPAEQLLVKMARQFRDWFKPGEQLTEEHGERLALWATGKEFEPAPIIADYEACETREAFDALEVRRSRHWERIKSKPFKAAVDAAAARLPPASHTATAVGTTPTPTTFDGDESWSVDAACKALRECGDEQALVDLYKRIDAFYGGEVPMDIEACRDTYLEQLNQL